MVIIGRKAHVSRSVWQVHGIRNRSDPSGHSNYSLAADAPDYYYFYYNYNYTTTVTGEHSKQKEEKERRVSERASEWVNEARKEGEKTRLSDGDIPRVWKMNLLLLGLWISMALLLSLSLSSLTHSLSLSSSGELKFSSCYKITWREMLTLAGL